MSNEIIKLLINSILVPLVFWGVQELVRYLKTKSKYNKIDFILDLTEIAVRDSVIAANQTYINELKEGGNFNAEEQKRALEKVRANVIKTLGENGEVILRQAVGDVNEFLTNKIEKEVALNKMV